MKHEWRKKEKHIYLPKNKPTFVDVPPFKYAVISGEGSPDAPEYAESVAALYGISYAIKMGLKKSDSRPEGYLDYTVYPLEGIWDLNERGRAQYRQDKTFERRDFVYKMMIRQPDFVDVGIFQDMMTLAQNKKGASPRLKDVQLEVIADGASIQMMHLGAFSEEPKSFEEMEKYAKSEGYERRSKIHREIYHTDPRKVEPEKYKTVLRFQVKTA